METLFIGRISRSIVHRFFFLCFLLSVPGAVLAQNGPVDPTYAPGFANLGGVGKITVQPDGKYLVGGIFQTVNGSGRGNLVRLNPDGTLDPTFRLDLNLPTQSFELLPNGKILVLPPPFGPTGLNPPILRFNANGALDPTFSAGTPDFGLVNAFAVQADGKIILSGNSTTGGVFQPRLLRLNADGTLDSGFSPSLDNIFALSILATDSGIVLLTNERTFDFQSFPARIRRLNTDGTIDQGFVVQDLSDRSTGRLFAQPDGKILLLGSFQTVGSTPRNGIARLNADGSLDATFNPGTGITGFGGNLLVQPDGKIILAGLFSQYNGVSRQNIARLNADGSLDATFNPTGGANGQTAGLARRSDGRLLIGGLLSTYASAPCTGIALTDENGTLVTSLAVTFQGAGVAQQVAVQSDDKAVVTGNFNLANGLNQVNVTRLNPDGGPDPTFNPTVTVQGTVTQARILSTGKILLAGFFFGVNGVPRSNLARLNTDGTLDLSFAPPVVDGIRTAEEQPDGKILIGGTFTAIGGITRTGLARLNADGSLDPNFNPVLGGGLGVNFPTTIFQLAVQSDGKILVTGIFNSVNGFQKRNFVRLNADGSTDTGYSIPFSLSFGVSLLVIQPDDRVLIAGPSLNGNLLIGNGLTRLNPDGSIDPTFSSANQTGLPISNVRLSPGGKIFVAASFLSGTRGTPTLLPKSYVFRLQPNGELDPTFSSTLGATGSIQDLAIQSDGKALLTGGFLSIGGTPIPPGRSLIRLNATTTSDCSFSVTPTSFTFSQAGGTGTLTVTTGTDCVWTSTLVRFGWITDIPNIDSGTQTVSFTVRPNTGAARTATFTIAGQTVTITQAGVGSASIGAYRPGNGFVYLRNTNDTGFADTQYFYGQAGDIPITGDWDGNGTDSVGVYRNGVFYLRNSATPGFADIQFPFGQPGDIPIAGDWDGDGVDTIGIVRGTEVFLRNSNSAGNADIQFSYGSNNDIYLAGDWNGDGVDTIGVYRPSTGFVYLKNSNFSGFAEIAFQYGQPGDKPVVGDWNNDGIDTIGVVRGNRWLLRNSNTGGSANLDFNYGLETDIPIAGDWNGQ